MASDTKDANLDEEYEYVLFSNGIELRVKKGTVKVGDKVWWDLPDMASEYEARTQKKPPPQLPDGMKRDEWISLDKK
jgi:hypothetical protein